MKPIKFKECNYTYAEDQPEYLPLPCHRYSDGTVTTCWQLSLKERIRILFTGRLFLRILTFKMPLQPLLMSIDNPIEADKQNQ